MKRFALLLLCLSCTSGCGTWFARTGWRHEGGVFRNRKYYPATHFDLWAISGLCEVDDSEEEISDSQRAKAILGCCIGVIDLPISLVTDTLFLPIDYLVYGIIASQEQADDHSP